MSPPARVLLIRHAPTAATRRHAFPADEPLDGRGRAAAAALAARVSATDAVTAPATRCRETATLAGFADPHTDARWQELDFGRWAGRTLTEVGEEDPDALTAWLGDPATPPPDGESLTAMTARVRAGLDALYRPGADTAVFTSAGAVKAALVSVLQAPPEAVWRIDVHPCAVTILHGHASHWTVRSVNTWSAHDDESGPAPVDPQGTDAPR